MKQRLLIAAGLAAAATLAACQKSPRTSASEVIAIYRGALPSDPGDSVWREAPVHPAPLVLQDLVEPRLLAPSTPSVRVQAVTDGMQVVFRMEWADPTPDTMPGMSRFADACAVQFPVHVSGDLPAPQMGEPGRKVSITYWSAAWQAVVDGRPDDIKELFPGAVVDHYPFEAAPLETGSTRQKEMADLYSPARRVGNRSGGPRSSPVEDLIAEGPGTLAPAGTQVSRGKGIRTQDGWAVVLARPLPEGVARGMRSNVAFAVWEGARREAGAKKMRSVWIPILIEGAS